MTLDQLIAFAKDADDCMSAADMFPPMLDPESKEKVSPCLNLLTDRFSCDSRHHSLSTLTFQIPRNRQGVSGSDLHCLPQGGTGQ